MKSFLVFVLVFLMLAGAGALNKKSIKTLNRMVFRLEKIIKEYEGLKKDMEIFKKEEGGLYGYDGGN